MVDRRKIALLIPVFNRLEHTQECFRILEKEKERLFFTENETFNILIDDGSTDGTEAWVNEHYPETIILKGDGDLWWSGAMNMGVKHALETLECDYILLWENDIIPVEDYFDRLHQVLVERESDIMVCSKVFYRVQPEIIFAMGGRFDSRSGKKYLIGRQVKDNPEYQTPLEVDWNIGQGVLIHKTIFEKVGLFDRKNFPQYSGDADFSYRVKKSGFRNVVYPELKLLNDTATTGISHAKNKSLGKFLVSLHSIRSNTSIVKDMKFYRAHATSVRAYGAVVRKYLIYTGSYIKWSVLGWFGIRRKNEALY